MYILVHIRLLNTSKHPIRLQTTYFKQDTSGKKSCSQAPSVAGSYVEEIIILKYDPVLTRLTCTLYTLRHEHFHRNAETLRPDTVTHYAEL